MTGQSDSIAAVLGEGNSHSNRNQKPTQKPVETSAHAPQVREELDFDAESLPVAARIQYPEVFETSPVTIDTATAATRFAVSSAVPPQHEANRGAVALIES